MPRAQLKVADESRGLPCPSCGVIPHREATLVTEKGLAAWRGCPKCWGKAMRCGQTWVMATLCRLADNPPVETPVPVMDARVFTQ